MVFSLAIFTSAFLLFQIQPLIAKYILPWYGGTPAVWSTCLVFFQCGLLAGYYYVFKCFRLFPLKKQLLIHLGLIIISLFFLPIIPKLDYFYSLKLPPFWQILGILFISLAIPYLIISASAPLIQHWYGLYYKNQSPYRLYALSNLGSLLGLLSYPFIIEPFFDLKKQSYFWSLLYLIYIFLCIICIKIIFQNKKLILKSHLENKANFANHSKISSANILYWIFLSFTGTALLLAFTNKICQDVASVPFLWIAPLSLYLISFIISFDSPNWFKRKIWYPLSVSGVTISTYLLLNEYKTNDIHLYWQLFFFLSSLFFMLMTCHGELALSQPKKEKLSQYYLYISLGGAVGGFFISFVSTQIFNGYWEFHFLILIFSLFVIYKILKHLKERLKPLSFKYLFVFSNVTFIYLVFLLFINISETVESTIIMKRNFFGVLSIVEVDKNNNHHAYELLHGRINHGIQFKQADLKMIPTTYYAKGSGVEIALHNYNDVEPKEGMKVGVIGLGTGSIAGYSQTNDLYKFYEINPMVYELNKKYFSYLKDSLAEIEVKIGDGRIELQKELASNASNQFDILVIDAFSGDAIPMHLLTKEAIQLYLYHLKKDGLLVFNITNLYINLEPVLKGFAKTFHLTALNFIQHRKKILRTYYNQWVILTNNQRFLKNAEIIRHTDPWNSNSKLTYWTDQNSNIFKLITN